MFDGVLTLPVKFALTTTRVFYVKVSNLLNNWKKSARSEFFVEDYNKFELITHERLPYLRTLWNRKLIL